jgi:hypothetical protein
MKSKKGKTSKCFPRHYLIKPAKKRIKMFNYKLLPKTPPTADKYFSKNNHLRSTFTKGYGVKRKSYARNNDNDRNKYYSSTMKQFFKPKKRLKSLTRSLNFTTKMFKIKEKQLRDILKNALR